MSTTPKADPGDVSDAEWEFLLFYITLTREDAPLCEYPLRDLFGAIRNVVKTGCRRRYLPGSPSMSKLDAGSRPASSLLNDRNPEPSATILDGRALQSTPESAVTSWRANHPRRVGRP